MKEYNRKTRVWEEKSTEQVGKLSKRDTCRGGRAHDYILVMPSYERHTDATPEQVEAYYQSQEDIRDFVEAEEKKLQALGILTRKSYMGSRSKVYNCSGCGKIHYNG